jgi:hypothetical protein
MSTSCSINLFRFRVKKSLIFLIHIPRYWLSDIFKLANRNDYVNDETVLELKVCSY